MNGQSAIDERVLFLVDRINDGKVLTQQRVLNDAVVHKGTLARMIELGIVYRWRICLPLQSRWIDRSYANGIDGVFDVGWRTNRSPKRRIDRDYADLPAHTERQAGSRERYIRNRVAYM